MKKFYFVLILVLSALSIFLILLQVNKPKVPVTIEEVSNEFSNEQIVNLVGYNGDAMEPYISRDEKFLFFNNRGGKKDKDIYYAEKVDNLTFQYRGEVDGVNTLYVDGNPTMDSNYNFYFISTRDIVAGDSNTLFVGKFERGRVTDLHKVKGTINLYRNMWVNMGVEITADGNELYISNARFEPGSDSPLEGDIRYALKEGDNFNIPQNEQEVLKNINTDYAIEYAGEVSGEGLELFYSQVTISNPPLFKLYYSKRNSSIEPFEKPKYLGEPFANDKNSFVEAPTLSSDGKRLYYHKLNNGKFSIFMISRD